MNYRNYGKTGKKVSEIGFGAWQLGNENDWSHMTDEDAINLVHEAIKEGINFFDTSPNYGLGKSESLLGEAIKGRRDQVVINTKFGHHADNIQDFSVSKIGPSVEASLKRLQTDYLDSVLLHNPPFEYLNGSGGHFDALEALKKEGKILGYGASVDSEKEMMELINHTNIDVIEVMYNIFFQEPSEAIAAAKEKGIAVIAKVPLDSGWLTGKYNQNSTFDDIRSRWTSEDIKKRSIMVEKIKTIIGLDSEMSEKALQFVLANKGVSTVIPGTKNMEQLRRNVGASQEEMDPKVVKALEEFYFLNLKNRPFPW